ncbi:MAG TPA: quinohemoprotein amine dehydrogenase subunit beta [Azospirillum sp.]|nr:quinohemoprotein amine dehydrogenase subunit beta [Azospirillum sp.]
MKSNALSLALAATLFAGTAAGDAAAKEFILTAVKPNSLVLVDPAARAVHRTYPIKGPGGVLGMVPSPDGKIAYAVTNRWGSLVGIDLDTGEEVFHADFSDGDVRVRNTFGLEISPDGKELFVMQSPVRLGLGEYEVQDVRVAVYRTDAGLKAKPVRFLPVPRRTTNILLSPDGSRLYCVSWDIQAIDPRDGRVLETHKVLNWERKDYAAPDVFGVWNQYEQAQVYVNPYFVQRTDLPATDPAAMKTGMLTLDLKTGAFKMEDFENTSVIIFSSVVNPAKRNETYSVYTTLSKTDLDTNTLVKRVPLPHTYYTINISSDGKEAYVAGTMDDIGVYSTETLERIGEIKMPGGADMGSSWIRMVQR